MNTEEYPWQPGNVKIYARLTDDQAARLVRWARAEALERPALQGRFFRPDSQPKMGAILRWAAFDRINQKKEAR